MTRQHLLGSDAILFVYDSTNLDSFKSLEGWNERIKKDVGEDVVKILIGNKNDIIAERKVKATEGDKKCR